MSAFEHLHGEEYAVPGFTGGSERARVSDWLKLTVRQGLSLGFRLVFDHGFTEERAEELLCAMESAGWLALAAPEQGEFKYVEKAFVATRSRALQDFLRGLWGACPYCVAHSAGWRRTLDEDAALLICCDVCKLEFLWSDWEAKRPRSAWQGGDQ